MVMPPGICRGKGKVLAEAFDQKTLAALVAPHLNTDPDGLHFSRIPTGKHNSSFLVEHAAARFVLRIAPPDDAGFLFYERLMMRQEPELHQLLRTRTNIPVPAIIAYDFSRSQLDRDYVIMTALPGTPLSEMTGLNAGRFDHVLRQVGQHLRQLHTLTATACLGREAYGYLGAHQPLEPHPTWDAAFRAIWNRLLDDVVACGSYTPAEAHTFRDLLDRHLYHFTHPVAPCLLHMDVWSQNILVDPAGTVTGLVDFDRALWGDIEIEFAVLDYCGISEPAFWEGYGKRRDASQSALIRRQFYLLYEVQKYMPIRIWRRNNPADAARYKQRSLALAAPLMSP